MKNKYPSPYEFQEVCNNYLKRSFVDAFSQERGLIFLNARQEDVSKELSHIMYEEKDLEEMRKLAYQTVSKHTLSGFTIKSTSSNFTLNDLYDKIRDNGELHTKGYSLKSLQKTTISGKSAYKGAIQYAKKKPGRIEFLEEEPNYSEFYFLDLQDGEWQVEVDGNKSSDGKEVVKLISGLIDTNSTSISNIGIDLLKQKQTIEFFDELAKCGLGTDWKFTDVKHLSFKRGKKDEQDIEDDENSEDATEEQLTGISQAILEGRNLREDPFVIQYEKGGCIFTAMTYEFEHKKQPETIQLKAEFKGNPKIFEVSVVAYEKTKGLEAKKESSLLEPDKHRELRSLFWNNAKVVFEKLTNFSAI